ncbi:hypothetical protein F5Y18DRAFT_421824 [Xylariaceae sp. FL1019]|nr:hypothetical protein F5Y18DRAFT_421824 [Xylariaceae sp. FL1019]
MAPTFEELEHACCDVIQIIKQIPELEHTRLSVIGGLALWYYLRDFRPTNNINFLTNISTPPSLMKKKLLERPQSPFFLRQHALFYQSPSGWNIQIDISPEWLSPYFPQTARSIHDIPYGEVPYISLIDLIVFKLDSSGLRSSPIKKERDARDAAALVDHEIAQHSTDPYSTPDSNANSKPQSDHAMCAVVQLSPRQEQVVEEALCDVVRCGHREKSWWESRLGLTQLHISDSPSRSRSPLTALNGSRSITPCANRPHSQSDPLPISGFWSPSSMDDRVAGDPGAAWYYERLDRAHVGLRQKWNNLSLTGWGRREGGPTASPPICSPPRLGIVRSSTYAGYEAQRRWWCGNGSGSGSGVPGHRSCTMNQPKTSARHYYAGNVMSAQVFGEESDVQPYRAPQGVRGRKGSMGKRTRSDSGYGSIETDVIEEEGFYSLEAVSSPPIVGERDVIGGYFDLRPKEPLGTVMEHPVEEGGEGRKTPGLVLRRTVTFQL